MTVFGLGDLAFLGAAGGVAAPLPLDLFPNAAAAYSLRLLRNAYTGAVVRVRRSSDNAEQDFTAAEVTNGAVTAFCGAGNGFVRTWYDQSGGGYHAGNASTSGQPQIVSSSSLITENGKPAVQFDGVNHALNANPAAAAFSGTAVPLHGLSVSKSTISSPSTQKAIWGLGNTSSDDPLIWCGQQNSSTSGRLQIRNNGITLATISGGTVAAHSLSYAQYTSSAINLRVNGAQVATSGPLGGAITLNAFSIGCLDRTSKSIFWQGTIQEIMLYAANMASSQSGLESNINAYYNIY